MENTNNVVLIVDDNEDVVQTLCKVVKASGIDFETANSGFEALDKTSKKTYNLILMDVNMPEMDGFETIQKIREKNIDTPIIIVSGRKEDFDTLYGLDIGADDYITKPFNPVTLGAKIKALIRRSQGVNKSAEQTIKAGPFSYDTSTLRFFKNDEEIFLTSKENAILKLFIDNVNRVFTKEVIYEMIWDNSIIDEQTVTVYINRLRMKIEDDPSNPKYIQTVRGIGYRFVL